tara:strand:- start:37 stop:567 length:531 start_codon:yes stop_codon:yes gene_type:complete
MKLKFCCICGKTEDLQHHHVIPKVSGGNNDETNLITLCYEHHNWIHGLDYKKSINFSRLMKKSSRKKKDNLKVYGHVPLGYDKGDDNNLVENLEEQALIREIFILREKGKSYGTIAIYLNDKGIRGKQGGKFYAVTISHIINNDIYDRSEFDEEKLGLKGSFNSQNRKDKHVTKAA